MEDACTVSQTSGRAARAEEMRSRLLDAAEALYAEEGAGALTNRRIAAAALTTTQSIYTYFGNRDELITEMFRRAVAGARQLLDSAVVMAPSVDDRTAGAIVDVFGDLARQYRAYCLAFPSRFRLIRSAGGDPSAPPEASELREQLVAALVRFGRSSGRWQEPHYEGRVRLTVAALHGFILAELESFILPDHDADRLYDELIRRCLAPFDQVASLEIDER